MIFIIVKNGLYPRKENKEPPVNVDKGKSKIITKKKEWVPLRSNPSSIGSSNAFVALAETHTQDAVPVKDVASNFFSFALQNVTDEVLQRVLAPVGELVLTLVTNEAHDDVQLSSVNRMLPVSDVTRSPVASALPSHLDEHVDVQEGINEETLMTRIQLPWILIWFHMMVGMSRPYSLLCLMVRPWMT